MQQRDRIGVQKTSQILPETSQRPKLNAIDGRQKQDESKAQQSEKGRAHEKAAIKETESLDPYQSRQECREEANHGPVFRHAEAINQRKAREPGILLADAVLQETAD